MKAVLQYRATPLFRARLTELAPAWLRVVVVDEGDKTRFAEEMRDAHVLLHVLEPVTREVIAAAPSLALIQKIGVGVNTIDLVAARGHGVGVANMPGTNTQAVVELALGLMLTALRRVVTLDRETRAGRGWQVDASTLDALGEVGGRTVGLVGFGAVGQRLAHVLGALGARVLYSARSAREHPLATHVALDRLLVESDVVSLHVPLVPETQKLLNASTFARMKRGAVLVNTARGGLVDEPALVEALRSGQLRAAGLDVFDPEPIAATSPLLALDNVVVTPHLAWLTPETLERSVHVAYENARRVRDREPLLHEIVPRTR